MKKVYLRQIANLKKTTLAFLAVLFCLMMKPEAGSGQITQRGTATSGTSTTTTLAIAKPSGVISGDVMIVNIMQSTNNSNALSNASLAGWTLIDGRIIFNSGGNQWYGTVLYRIADGTEGASFTFSLDADAKFNIGSIVAFSGVNTNGGFLVGGGAGGPFDVAPGIINAPGTNTATVSAPSITTATANAGILMLSQSAGNNTISGWTTTSPGALTEFADNAFNSTLGLSVGSAGAIKATAGATGTGTATLSANARNGGILLALRPLPPYKVQFSALNTGASTWCAGETRNITITVTNVGTATWTSGGAGVNFSYWWSNQNRDFNTRILPFAGLAPNQSQIITVPVIATTAGTFTLDFDLVREGSCWFADNVAGCSGPGNAIFLSPSITINPLPTITPAASATAVCFNASAQTTPLTYSAPTNAPTTYSITWNAAPANSFVAITNAALPANPITINVPAGTAPGTYTGTITVANANGCVSSTGTNFTITVNPLPTITPAASATAVCFSASAQTTPLTYSATNTPTTYSITWNAAPANSFVAVTNAALPASPITINVPAGTAAGTYTGTITVKNANGCVSSTGTNFTVTVNPLPTITPAASATAVCFSAGAQTTPLTYSATTNAPTTYSITWNAAPANSFVAVTNAALPASPITINVPAGTAAGTYTGTITVKNANGCASSAGTTFTVTVNPLPTITPAASATAVCFSASAQTTPLTYSATTNAPTTYSITWNAAPANSFVAVTNAALPASPITINVPAGTAVGTYTGTITVANANGCVSSTGTNFTITVNPLPTITPAASATAVCFSASAQTTPLTYSATNAPTTYSITWNAAPANSFVAVTNAALPASPITINVPAGTAVGTYTGTITVANANGCVSSTGTSFTVTVNDLPTITPAASATAVCFSAGAQTTPLTYSATTNTPTTYSITWNAAPANSFVAVANAVLPASPITINVPAGTAAGTYTGNITVKNGNGCSSSSSTSFTITVNQTPQGSLTAANGPFCTSGAGQLTWTATAGTGPFTVVYNDGSANQTATNVASGTPFNVATNPVTSTTTYTLVSVTDNNGCTGSTFTGSSATITVYQPPVVTTDPGPATQTVCASTNVTYTVSATGDGLTYQWLKNGNPISNGGNISGATSAALTITNVTISDNGDYSVTVSGTAPCTAATSASAHLNVDQRIIYTAQPVTPQTICQGQLYTISASATGTVAIYNWYKVGTATPYASGTFDGVNTYTLTIPGVATTDAGQYYLFLDDGTGVGCTSANSNTAVLNVNTTTTTSNPLATQTDCQNGASTALSVTASGTGPFTYQWYSNTVNDNTTGTIIGSATSSTYTPPTTTAGTTYYYAIVTGNCNSVTSATAQVVVNPITTIGTNPAGATYCQNDIATALSVSATGTGTLTYQWYKNTVNNNTSGTAIGGQTSSTYTPSTVTAGTLYYYVTVTGGCGTITSTTATIIVNPSTIIGTQPATTTTYCQNATAAVLSVSATGTGTLTYQWYSNTVNNNTSGTAIGGQTSSTYTPSTVTAGTLYYYVTVTGGCGTVTSSTATIIVNPSTIIGTQPATTTTYCQNATAIALSVSATGTGTLTYQWYKNTVNNNTSGTAIGGQTSSTYTPSTVTAGTLYYYVTVTGGCGTVTSSTATIIVNPSTIIGTQPATTTTYCQNATAAALSVSATGTGTLTYQWYSNTVNNNTSGTAIGGQTSSTYTPSTVTAGTLYYYVTVTGGCGTVTSSTATIIVNPSTIIGTQPATTTTYCQNATATALSVSATGTGTLTYQWYKNTVNNNTSGTAIGGQTSSTYTPSTVTAGTLYYYVTVTGGCGTITSTTATIIVNPSTIIGTQPATTTTYCQNATAAALSVSATGTGTLTYQWYSNTVNNNTSGTAIGGQTSSTYTPSTVTAGTLYYYVTVTGGCGTVTSSTATIIVNPSTIIGTQPATTTTYCQNATATALSVSATGYGTLSYQWYKNTTNSTTGGTAVGTNSSTYTPLTTTAGTLYYYVTVTGGCGSATSTTAQVVVTPSTTISSQPTGATYCLNGTASALSVTAAGTGTLSYQWYSNTTNSTTGGTAVGTNSSTYTPSTATAGTLYYYVTVTGGCGTATSTTAQVTVNTVGSWLGITSTDWFTASNWGCGVIPTATTDVTIPASGVTYQPTIGAAGAVCHSITINGSLTMSGAYNLDVNGDWTNNGTFTPSTGSITFKGASNNTMAGSNATTFYNLIINKGATANTVTSTTKAFTVNAGLTITQGDLILQSTDANYTVTGDISVPAAGILTYSSNWDTYGKAIVVSGNIAIDGIYNYTTRSTVYMIGNGSRTVRTGTNPASGFSIFLLQNGNFSANGTLVVNDNFWAMFGTAGNFYTNGQTVTANAGVLISGGAVNINGGTLNITASGLLIGNGAAGTTILSSGSLNVTGGIQVGIAGGAVGTFNFSGGTLTTDALTIGTTTAAINGTFAHSGGTANINGNLLINNTTTTSAYTCSNSPVINITGNWTNNETSASSFVAATSQVNFNGTAFSTIAGLSPTFYNLKIANAAGVSISTNVTVSNTLDLTSGLVTTGANTLTSSSTVATSIINYSASSYVNGKLARAFATGAGSKVSPIGAGGNYRPLTFAETASSAAYTITAQQFESAISGTVTPATVNIYNARYWEITKTGTGTLSYTVTLDPTGWVPSGLVYIVKKEGASTALTATAATTPNYTNSTAFTTFNSSTTASGTNDFALGADCSSSANAGAALAAICQGGTSAPLGGSVSGTATGGTWTDGGVGGTFNPNAITLNATWTPPAAYSGTATLTLTPTGGICAPNTASSKTIVVNGDATITLTSAAATTSQTVCINTAITPITYQIGGGGTGATLTGQPAGINGSYNPGTKVYTVSGTPTASGAFNYTVTTTGPCVNPSLGGTITVQPQPTTANAGTTDITTCTNVTSVTLAANTPTVGTAVWSIDGSSPSTLLTQFSSLTSPSATFTPAGGAGVYKLYWTISNGTCTPSTDFVLVTVNPPPTITGQPANQAVCANIDPTFTVTATGVSLTYQWQYSPDNGVTPWANVANGTPATITYPGATTNMLQTNTQPTTGNGTYYYRCMVTGSGCAAVASASASLTVYATPTVSAAGPDQTICSSTASVTLAANIPVNGTGTGTWSVSTGPSTLATQFSNVNNPAATFTPAGGIGTYVLVWTISNGTCTPSTDQINIIVNPIPTGTLVATENSGVAPNDNIICQGGSVTFSFSNSTYGSYIFKVNGTVKQTGTSNDFSTTTLNTGDNVTVDVANAFNCGATFGPITITVNQLPSPTLSASKNPICVGDNVTFTAGGGTSYNFKINGSSVQNSAATTYSTTAINNGDVVTVDVKNVGGCVATSAPIAMVVNGLPAGSLTVSPGTTVCVGTNVTFTASTGFTTYQFYVNGVSVQGPGAANTYSTTTLTNGSVVTVTATNGSGCSKTFTGVSMTVNALPSGSIANTENSGTPNNNIICAGAQVTFTATAGFTNYAFYLNGTGGAVQNGSSNAYSSTTLNNGDYVTAVVTNSNGCIATFTSASITVIQPPSGSLTASSTTICAGTNVVFTATAGFTNYNFKLNGNPVQNGSSNTYNNSALANGGAVTVDVTNSNGCLSTFGPVTITVNALPTGTIVPVENSGLTPNDGIICTGAIVVFTAPTGSANYDFLLNGVTVQSGPSNTYTNNTLNNGDQVTAAVTNGSGCVGVLNTITITVNTLPVVAPITGASAVCVNSTITLSDMTAAGVWSSSNNTIASINASGVFTGVSAGTVTISYTVTNANGCSTTVTFSVTVNDVPTVSPVIGNFSVCVGSTTQLSDATSPGTWSSSNNGTATVDGTGLVTGVSSGSVTISYSVMNANGCTTVVTALITVNDVPVVAPITGTMNVCVNNTTTLADITSGGTWSSGNTSIATVNASGIVTGVSAGSVIISYSVTNMQGCNTTVTANVTVNPLPVPTLSGPNPICPNATDTYTTEAGQSNYAWAYTGGTLVSGGTATDNTITITWDQPGARTISVNYQNSFGCSGATSATVLTSTGITPTLSGTSPVCLNATGNYTTQSGFSNYTWSATGGIITPGTAPNDNTATVNWTTVGTGSVSINFTDGNGCTAASPTILPVTVHSLPTATISGNASVCQNGPGQQVTFTGATGTAPYTFIYTINGGLNQTVTTTSGNSITVTQGTGSAGPYNYTLVSVSDYNGCSQSQAGSATITVNPLATGTVNGITAVCMGSSPSPVITFTGTTGFAPFTFKYNINGGTTQTVTTTSGNSVTVAAPTGTAGNFVYNLLSVSDANGCLNPQSGSATITVNPNPTATISGTTSVCINSTSPNITFTGANGTAPYTFTYNINGGSNVTVTSVGNTAIVPAPTTTAGTFIYNLVSVVDASTTLCSQAQTGSATVTVTPASVGGSLASNATVCSGSNTGTINLTGNTGNVIRWEFSTDGGVTWTAIANTTSSFTYTNITQTTQYRAVVQSGVCSSANSTAATIAVNAVSVGGSVANNATVCSGTNGGTLNLTGNTGNVIRWEFSTDGGITWTVIANTTSSFTYTNITQTTQYRAVVQSGVCSSANSTAATITINPVSVGGSVANNAAVCSGTNSGTLTLSGQTGSVIRWEFSVNGGSTWSTIANTTTSQTYTNLIQTTLYRAVVQSGVCASANSAAATITVNALPAAPTVTASPATICSGGSSNLVVTSAGGSPTTIVNYNFNSGASYATITPALATNITSTVSGTATFGTTGGTASGANAFTANATAGNALTTIPNKNWVFTLGGTALSTYKTFNVYYQASRNTGGSNTITLAYSINGGAFSTTGITSTVGGNPVTLNNSATWYEVSLSLPASANNPTTSLAFQLTVANSGTGNVQIDNFQVQATASITNTYSWSATPAATAGLPGSAGTPSTSNSNISVSPTATTQYTVTATNVSGCSSTANVTVTVNPVPTVTITADYCIDAGKVRLTATSIPSGATFVWNTGQTGSIIDVDEASNDTVTATLGTGCSAIASIQVAQELVVNGNFESGGISPSTVIGFTSDYAFKPDTYATLGLQPPGLGILYDDSGNNAFSITPNGQNVHINFWGHDHTTGTGNFMAVNGHGNTLVVWKETVNVLPNTTYYFSAWAMSLNNVGPFAQLQFSVNGTLVGTAPVLAAGVNNNSNNGWTRFYGTWTSGPTTTSAQIYINDLQSALGGNDFGLDDISFGTLSTFIELESGPGTDSQTVCVNTPITNIVYSVGSTASTPTIAGLPPGLTTSFNGVLYTISGTPTAAGDYAYTVTTTGSCNPTTATGIIHVQSQTITLSSGTSAPTVCINTPVNIGYTLGGTAMGATATGLPAGVNISVAGTAVTISGSPTVAGVYPFTITTSGTCTPATATGTITVQNQTITLTSANSTQTVCINASIANIQYTVGGTGTGASATGLPAGVGGTYNSSGLFIISGTPTASGTFNYTVTTSGSTCPAATATAIGTITVTPAASLTLTSGNNIQAACNGGPIAAITYTINNGTGASVSGLPTGVTGSVSGSVFTINGTPTVSGTFNYTVTTSGGCGSGTATGTLTINTPITLSSGSASPTVCINAALLPAIVYTLGGTATSATVTGLPTGVGYAIVGSTLTISGTPSVSGPFPYTITTSGTCANATASGTITVQPAATGGSIANVSICSGGSGSLTVTGQAGSIVRWEYSTDGGTTWTPVANTTITQTFTNVTVPTLYRVVVGNGCGNVTSTGGVVAIHNYWVGSTSTDWNTASNWSDNLVPSTLCPDVYVPNTVNKPVLSSAPTSTITNLHILAGGQVTINGTGLMQIGGTISNLGTFDVSNGAIELNGALSQAIAANTFKNNAVNDLIITNSAGVTLGGAVDVYRSLTYGKNGAILNTGGFLTLKSTVTQTAWIGDMTNHTINGNVTVERYIATGNTGAPNHGKSWQLLGIPTFGSQTIKQAWQDSASVSDIAAPTPPSAGNLHAGYGTMLTSNVANAATQPTPGFDVFTSTGPSIEIYDSLSGNYFSPASTALPIYNPKGYFVFVRGDRSITSAFTAANPTTLRTKGTLFTPANTPPVINVAPNTFESAGNPYASAIDMRTISKSGNMDDFFYVWDPRLGGQNGYGAFQTLYKSGSDYYANPGGTSTYGSGPIDYIQSGQAFLVHNSSVTPATLNFAESNKANGSALFTTPNPVNQVQQILITNLRAFNPDGTTTLADGVLSNFDNAYSNAVDGMDARKSINTGENLAIRTGGKLLSIERRQPLTAQDTIFLNITGERAQQYLFHFNAENLDLMVQGILVDSYTNTRTPLNMTGSTDVNFTVANVTGSNAANRFMIVFEPLKALPVTFTSITAYKQDKNINVQWRVDNEANMKQYEVDKSTDGNQFTSIAIKQPTANNGGSAVYVITDASPVEGFNYYRVKSLDVNGQISYTTIVKVLIGSLEQDITIYPNPITDGTIHLQFKNEDAGKYHIRLLNKLGQLILQQQFTHAGGNATDLIKWDYNLAHGMYQLEITKPDGTAKDINVMY